MYDSKMQKLACALATMIASMPAAAQSVRTTLVGSVRDSAGHAVSNVEVWLRGSDLFAHTNDQGGFRIVGAPIGASKITLRRLGFEQATVELELQANRIDSLVVSLTTVAAKLPGVTVEDDARSKRLLAGFWDRREKGIGHYLTRDEIASKNALDFTDIVRQTPGVVVETVSGRRTVRFSRAFNIRGECPPLYWVDGMRVEGGTPDLFPPGDMEAIELYSGTSTIPSQFSPRSSDRIKTCGAIVIWTRLPGT
ncbi:MAG: carboxypeptidase regulatory-like domain-containing protein [Gemmatimonadota bacterium]